MGFELKKIVNSKLINLLLIICYSQLRETETRLTGFDPATFAVTERRSPN